MNACNGTVYCRVVDCMYAYVRMHAYLLLLCTYAWSVGFIMGVYMKRMEESDLINVSTILHIDDTTLDC